MATTAASTYPAPLPVAGEFDRYYAGSADPLLLPSLSLPPRNAMSWDPYLPSAWASSSASSSSSRPHQQPHPQSYWAASDNSFSSNAADPTLYGHAPYGHYPARAETTTAATTATTTTPHVAQHRQQHLPSASSSALPALRQHHQHHPHHDSVHQHQHQHQQHQHHHPRPTEPARLHTPAPSAASASPPAPARIKREPEADESFVFEHPSASFAGSQPQHPFSTGLSPSPALGGDAYGGGQGQMSNVVPSEVPLRATQASAAQRRMMGVFRLNPFAMHDGVHSASRLPGLARRSSASPPSSPSSATTTTTGPGHTIWGEARPLEHEPVEIEWQAALDPPDVLVPEHERDRGMHARDREGAGAGEGEGERERERERVEMWEEDQAGLIRMPQDVEDEYQNHHQHQHQHHHHHARSDSGSGSGWAWDDVPGQQQQQQRRRSSPWGIAFGR
ncbi:hypothetical protein PUNSTDRAFT_45067 [Punctularia strigosozonata HHB-11173 SS5]|uniref:uncharacterized protein n=1 Tax=Punctularia strigosozonata (strain HHB-11173) TaxID=741275 RepID=UPI00044179C1|nr:uncharacterized protein PUNSTDRAFT_45067 [Punctularia strigosozonata HHB-11173 SS5]EIN08611.1 hypothetical protein PUNSTDRAFT_45067 [Punctularia strigosozonata HHB-11173 SS5]